MSETVVMGGGEMSSFPVTVVVAMAGSNAAVPAAAPAVLGSAEVVLGSAEVATVGVMRLCW